MQFVLDSAKRRYVRADGDAVKTVKVLEGDTVYYGGPAVDSASNDGTLTEGADETFSVSKWLLSQGSSRVDVKDELSGGLSEVDERLDLVESGRVFLAATGTAGTDTAALQGAFDDAVAGTTFFLSGTFQINAQVSWSNKELHLVCLPGAKLVEASALSVPLLLNTNGDDSTVDVRIQGAETAAGFDGLDSNRDGVRFDAVDRGYVRARTSNKSIGVRLKDCNRTDCWVKHTGFATGWVAGVNNQNAVRVQGSTMCGVDYVDAKNTGSAVLNSGSSSRTRIGEVATENCYDNAVYVSSGNGCTLGGPTNIYGPSDRSGTGMKWRGSRHSIGGAITIQRVKKGIVLTGNGTTLTEGANGEGTVLHDGYVIDDVAEEGVLITTQDGFDPRNFTVGQGTITNTDGARISATGYGHSLPSMGGGQVVKTIDETVNNSATLQDDDELKFNIGAGETWLVEAILLVEAASASADWQFAWSGPSGATARWGVAGFDNSGGHSFVARVPSGTVSVTSNISQGAAIAGAAGVQGVRIVGYFTADTTPGTIQFRWAQNTATAEDSKVLANSLLILRRIA